jgi:hypothetical protein
MVQAVRGQIPGIKPAERLRAAETILDRGHGKAVQAVISVPSRQAVALRLASMSDDDLLRIAQNAQGTRGEYPPREGPNVGGERGGTIRAGAEPHTLVPEGNSAGYEGNSAGYEGNGLVPEGNGLMSEGNGLLPEDNGFMRNADIVDGEFEEQIDPLS